MAVNARQVKEVFGAVIEIPESARDAYLDRECVNNAELRQRLDALLIAHDAPASVLKQPLAGEKTGDFSTANGSSSQEKPGTIIAGRYKLLEQIGEGGMGEVWVADQLEPIKRRVAIKLIKAGMDSRSVLGRFEAERQALAIMDHPNIAKVLDAGSSDDGRPYFVMELVKGTPITEFCDLRKLSTKERLELFIPVCQAIQHAHMKGIIHRDIKPSNVLVALHDETPVPKVIDFGVAKAIGQQLTEMTIYTGFGTLIGTPSYMAPEQATFNQLDVDTRADVYALGVLLYELLAGSPPIEKERLKKAALDEVLRIVRDEEPPRPSHRLSTSQAKACIAATRKSDPAKLSALMKGDLDWIVMKALEKDRTRRYDTANGIARDILHYLADEPVDACPPSAGYRLQKLARKYKKPLGVVFAFTVLLFVAVVFTTWQAVRATHAESEARVSQDKATKDRDLALNAEHRADAEKANAQATLRFLLVDVLEQADPARRPDRDMKVRNLLDEAAKRLDETTNLPDIVSASIRQTMGKVYLGLGEMPQAEQQLTNSYAIWKKVLGQDDPKTIDAAYNVATLYFLQSRFQDSEPLLHFVINQRTRLLGVESPETLEAIHGLSALYMFREEYEAVVQLVENPLKLSCRALGSDHKLVTIRLMRILGKSYCELGRESEGETLLVESLRLARLFLPKKHPDPPVAMTMLAGLYLRKARLDKAEALAEEAFNIRKEILGASDPGTLMSQLVLVSVYIAQGRTKETTLHLSDLLAKVDARKKDRLPAFLIEQIGDLGRELVQHGNLTEAEEFLKLYLTMAQSNLADSWRRAAALSVLGNCLARQNKLVESEPLLIKGYEGLRRNESKIPALLRVQLLTEALEPLVRLYDQTHKLDEAAKWRKELSTVSQITR